MLGVYDKGKPGTVMETQVDIVDKESGEVYTRVIGSAFFVGQGGWGGPKGASAKSYPVPKDKSPDAVFENPTNEETAALYRLNGGEFFLFAFTSAVGEGFLGVEVWTDVLCEQIITHCILILLRERRWVLVV